MPRGAPALMTVCASFSRKLADLIRRCISPEVRFRGRVVGQPQPYLPLLREGFFRRPWFLLLAAFWDL